MGRIGNGKSLMLGCALSGLLVLSGCASSQPPAQSAEKEATDKDSGGARSKAELPPLTPVEAPPGVVVRFRVTNPSQLADGLFEAMALPFDIESLKSADSGSVYLGAADLQAAVEGAVVLNPVEPTKPFRFFSVGAKSINAVLSALEKKSIVAEEGPGSVYHFKLKRGPCLVGRSMGQSSARVVCSDDRDSLRGLADYALRGLPNEKLSPAAAFFQVDLRPVKQRYQKELQRVQLLASVGARQLHVGHPKLDRALTDASIGLAEELSDLLIDTDQLIFELEEKSGNLVSTLRFEMSQERSTTVRTLREHAQAKGPAPDLFRALPKSSTFAEYSREISAERAEPWMSVLSDLASGYAEYRGTSAEFSQRIARFFRSLGPSGNTFVLATGPVKEEESGLRPQWSVLGTTQAKDAIVQSLDDLAWLLASPELSKVVKDGDYVPELKRLNAAIPGAQGAAVYSYRLPEEAEDWLNDLNEPDTQAFSDTDYKKRAREWMDGHIAVWAQKDVTWITWSSEGPVAELGKSFAAVTKKEGGTLGDVSELEQLLATPALAAGFYKIDGIAALASFLVPQELAKDWNGLVRATPGRGAIPTTFFTTIEKQNTSTTLLYEWRVPKEFTRDAAALGTMIVTEMQQASGD